MEAFHKERPQPPPIVSAYGGGGAYADIDSGGRLSAGKTIGPVGIGAASVISADIFPFENVGFSADVRFFSGGARGIATNGAFNLSLWRFYDERVLGLADAYERIIRLRAGPDFVFFPRPDPFGTLHPIRKGGFIGVELRMREWRYDEKGFGKPTGSFRGRAEFVATQNGVMLRSSVELGFIPFLRRPDGSYASLFVGFGGELGLPTSWAGLTTGFTFERTAGRLRELDDTTPSNE